MTSNEREYQRIAQFISDSPDPEKMSDALDDLRYNLSAVIAAERSPATLDDIRAWPDDPFMAEEGFYFLIARYGKDVYGYTDDDEPDCLSDQFFEEEPSEEEQQDLQEGKWCPDWLYDIISDVGVDEILAIERLHTIEEFVEWTELHEVTTCLY